MLSIKTFGTSNKIVWSATPTPFLENGSLDRRGIERLVQQHIRLGASGLFVGGTCGEGAFIPDSQRAELFQEVKKAAGDSLHIAAHVSDTSAARAIENIKRAADAGADSVVIAPPYLVADFCNRDFLRRYFLKPIEAASIPVGVYVRMPLSKMALDLSLWDEIISHPQVALVKDSSGSPEYRSHFLKMKKENRSGATFLTGFEFDVLSWAAEGYDGCLVGTGIFNAGMIGRALERLAAGDLDGASQWQEKSNRLLYDLFCRDLSSWLTGLKYALCKTGIFSTEYSHLIFSLNAEDRSRIDAALDRERPWI